MSEDLQTLVTRVTMEATSFMNGVDDVIAGMKRLETIVVEGTAVVSGAFEGMAAVVVGALGEIKTAAATLGDTSVAIAGLGVAAGNIGAAAAPIEGMVTALGKIGAPERKNIEKISESLKGIGAAVAPLKDVHEHLTSLKDGIVVISKAGPSFKNAADKLTGLKDALVGLEPALEPMGRAVAGLDQIRIAFDNLTPLTGQITGLKTAISELGRTFHGFANAASVMDGSQSTLRRFARSLALMESAARGIPAITTALEGMVQALPTLTPASGVLARVGRFFEGFAAAVGNIQHMPRVASAVRHFADEFALIAPTLNTPGIAEASSSLGKVGTFLSSLNRFTFDPAKTTGAAAAMSTFFGVLSNASNQIIGLGEASTAVSRFTGFMRALTNVDTSGAKDVRQHLWGLFNILDKANNIQNIGGMSLLVSRLTSSMNALSNANVGNMRNAVTSFADVVGVLGQISAVPDLRGVSLVFGRLTNYIKILSTANIQNLPALITPLRDFFAAIGQLDAGQLAATQTVLKSVSGIGLAMGRMANVDTAKMIASVNALRQVATILNSIPITENAERASMVFTRIGNAMRNMGGAGGGGGGGAGGFFGDASRSGRTLVGALESIPSAMLGSASATTRLTQAFRSLYIMSGAVENSLYGFRLSVLGIAILGATQFARLDEEIRKVAISMRDFGMESRGVLQAGLFGMSTKGPIGATSLAASLQILAASGYNATAAMQALAISEEYAVATGMDATTATKSLLGILSGTGQATTDVEESYKRMTRLADLLVGTSSRLPGVSAEELSRGFTVKYMSAIRNMKVSIEDSMALLGMFGMVGGEQGKGTAAGNAIARALNNIMADAPAKKKKWEEVLGTKVFSESGQMMMPVIDLLELMQRRMGSLGTAERAARLDLMGFGPMAISVIAPLLDNAAALKTMRDEIAATGNISHEAAELMKGSIISQLKQLWNAASNAASIFGQYVAPVFYVVTRAVVDMSEAFQKLNPAFQSLLVWTGILAMFGPYLIAAGVALVDFALAVVLMPVHLAMALFTGVVEMLVQIPSIIESAAHAVAYVRDMVGTVLSTMWAFATRTASVLSWVFNIPIRLLRGFLFYAEKAVALVSVMFQELATSTTSIMGLIRDASVIAMRAIMEAVASVGVAIGSIILNLIVWAVLLGPIVTLLAVVVSAAGALLLTIGVTVYNLALMVGGFLVAAWNAFKDAAVNAAAAAGRGINDVVAGARNMWENLKIGTEGFVTNATRAITVVAGFFWHFGDNMRVIWDHIGKYGEQMFADITRAALYAVEVMGNNLILILFTVGRGINVLVAFVVALGSRYMDVVGGWLGFLGQWKNIVSDMGAVFNTFLLNFATNFGKSFDIVYAIVDLQLTRISAKWAMESMKWNPVAAAPGVMDALKKRVEEDINKKEQILIDWQKKLNAGGVFVEPFANMPKMKTDWGVLWKGLNSVSVVKEWKKLTEQLVLYWGQAFEEMLPISDAFTEIVKSEWYKSLMGPDGLKFELPENWAEQGKAMIDRLLKPAEAAQEATSVTPDKGGPGFKLKQISRERYMVGGPVAEGLEIQQLTTLKSMDTKLGQLVTAANKGGVTWPNLPSMVPTLGE